MNNSLIKILNKKDEINYIDFVLQSQYRLLIIYK